MKTIILISLLFCNTAFACDSYEDCKQQQKVAEAMKPGVPGMADHFRLLAIEYRLDEISKKLDKPVERPILDKNLNCINCQK